ncbi:MAG TPA: ATP-binding protein [Burkholderiales bacterium]|nr:ATP-binding protein [Burkholderiales bacterium]
MRFRLVPRSLFSRLVLVLLTGLVIAQLLSFAVHMHERGELLSQASGRQAAQRIADIVRLLDSLAPAERRRIVQVFNAPPIMISLDQPALTAQGQDDAVARAALFDAMLRRFIGDGRPVSVSVTVTEAPVLPPGTAAKRGQKGAGMHGAWEPPWAAMHGAAQPGLSFIAQVPLRDGALVTFDARQPAQTVTWPYRVLASLAILLIAVVAVSLLAVRWATRPLNAMADAAEALGGNINRPPMPESGPTEVVRAARAFNTMQARLASYIRDRTRVLAAMSHDLKTPITRLRLRSELLDDPQLREKYTADLQEMESMVGATLDFLRGLENGEAVRPVDVMALLESLQADLAEIGGTVTIEGSAQAPYPGRPQALKRCLANLLENAVKYGKSAKVIVVDGEGRLEMRIQDEGPGLAQAELEKVFEPFYRLESSRSRETGGTGLGLTIAKSVAEAHGGSLVLRNRAGGGLEAMLFLPRPAAQPESARRNRSA